MSDSSASATETPLTTPPPIPPAVAAAGGMLLLQAVMRARQLERALVFPCAGPPFRAEASRFAGWPEEVCLAPPEGWPTKQLALVLERHEVAPGAYFYMEVQRGPEA